MAQIFHPGMNALAKGSILGVIVIVIAIAWVAAAIDRSSWSTEAGVVRAQPVPFSHEHHVRGLGIDCRYCHTSVEKSSFAGMSSTSTCMTCHSQIWRDAPILAPVRDSWLTRRPIKWTRVHNLPDFAYFNHSIHVNKGVGCSTCHGEVDRMPLMFQTAALQMEWCLQCHREPEKFVRPRDQIFNMSYTKPRNQDELGAQLVKSFGIHKEQLTNCSICHR